LTEALSHLDWVDNGRDPIARGRVGLLMFDSSTNSIVTLTAGQIVRGTGKLKWAGGTLGCCSPDLEHGLMETEQPASNMVEMIKLDPRVAISRPGFTKQNSAERSWFSIGATVSERVNETLLIHNAPTFGHRIGQHPPSLATVKSPYAPFRMPIKGHNDSTLFQGAILLEAVHGSVLTREGDAGAIVSTLDGDVVGIIIAGRDNFSFAAPIAPICTTKPNIRLITDEDVHWWNSRTNDWNQEQAKPMEISLRQNSPDVVARYRDFVPSDSTRDTLDAHKELVEEYC
jgi:hypothetical protein